MGEPNLNELQSSIEAGDRERFKRDFSAIFLETPNRFALQERVAEIAAENDQLVEWLVEIMCKPEDDGMRRAAFFCLLSVGPSVFPALRKAWEHGLDRGRIHLCMMDITCAAANHQYQGSQMSAAARQEVPHWLECVKSDEWRLRLWAVMILPELVRFAPDQAEEAKRRISAAALDENELVRQVARQRLAELANH